MISVLCTLEKSNYNLIPGLDLWPKSRNAYLFYGSNPVITHAPCQQWSRLKAFAKPDPMERDLAHFCIERVLRNGGIFEHPNGSSFFKEAGVRPQLQIDQKDFGFPATKKTLLFSHGYKFKAVPLTFSPAPRKVTDLDQLVRSRQPLAFCEWLVSTIIDPL